MPLDITGSLAATNSTFAANTATDGGGVFNNQGTLEFINATIAYNQASSIGGGLDLVNGNTSLYNTLVALNTAGCRVAGTQRRHRVGHHVGAIPARTT